MSRQLLAIAALTLAGAAACDAPGLFDGKGKTWVRYIDAEGGLIVSEDGRFAFRFPRGALDQGVSFELRQSQPEGARFAGLVYALARLDGGPAEIALKKPASITLRYLDSPRYLEPPALGQLGPGAAWSALDAAVEKNQLVVHTVLRTGAFVARDACSADAACAEGWICEESTCVPPACSIDADCTDQRTCAGGRCHEPVCRDTCSKDGDCKTDETCDPGADGCHACVFHPTCKPVAEICDNGKDDDCDGFIDAADDDCATPGCRNDNGCPRGTWCVEGLCVQCRTNDDCDWSMGFSCTSTTTHECQMIYDCGGDADCPPDAGCWMEPGYSFCMACPPQGSPYRCNSDMECAKGTICGHWGNGAGCGMCQPAECASDTGCADGFSCVAGRCLDKRCHDKDADGYPAEADCGKAQDCDDTNQYIHPGASETCNGLDDDCHGGPDDGDPYMMCLGHPPGGGSCMDGKCF
jgi:hypothetical protein